MRLPALAAPVLVALALAGCSLFEPEPTRSSVAPASAAPARQPSAVDENFCGEQAHAVIERDSNIDTDIDTAPEMEETQRELGNPATGAFTEDQRFEGLVDDCLRARGTTPGAAPAAAPPAAGDGTGAPIVAQ